MAEVIPYIDILNEAWDQHLAPRPANAPTVISTFAGCGGSSLGYSMAGFRELLAVEWDDHAVATFRSNFPGIPVFHGDIAKLSVEEVLEQTGLRPGELDVFDGSPPCQGFSTMGKRILSDPRNQLFQEYVRLMRGLNPKIFIMENVSGMVKGKMRLMFAEILQELRPGYRVSVKLLNSAHYHVPQSRQRLIFIGIREDLRIEPSHPMPESQPITMRSALFRLKEPGIHAALNQKAMILAKQMRQGEDGSQIRKRWGHKSRDFSLVRTSWNRPCPTILKSLRISHYGMYLHPTEHRSLSDTELKRLGSFPDQFILEGDIVERWARIGNSVPPLLMRAIARHIRDLLSSDR